MGIFYDLYKATYEDDIIEIEGRLSFGADLVEFSLLINNERRDTQKISFGEASLRGKIPQQNNGSKFVVVEIWQGLFKTKYRLLIDAVEYPLTKVK
jgi:hypothetical protein